MLSIVIYFFFIRQFIFVDFDNDVFFCFEYLLKTRSVYFLVKYKVKLVLRAKLVNNLLLLTKTFGRREKRIRYDSEGIL